LYQLALNWWIFELIDVCVGGCHHLTGTKFADCIQKIFLTNHNYNIITSIQLPEQGGAAKFNLNSIQLLCPLSWTNCQLVCVCKYFVNPIEKNTLSNKKI